MLKSKIESIKRYWHDNIEPYTLLELILKYRKTFLVGTSLLGAGLAVTAYYCFCELGNDILHSSLTILALGLPTFFILWLFRTHDVQENINNSTLFECAQMLTEEEDLPKKIALEQLAYLRRETSFNKKRIDLITQGTKAKDLSDADLRGLDLSKAELSSSSSLENADLRNAILVDANLVGTKLKGADLRGADLRNADLRTANLQDIKLSSATYNDKTNFDSTLFKDKKARDDAGMIYEPDE